VAFLFVANILSLFVSFFPPDANSVTEVLEHLRNQATLSDVLCIFLKQSFKKK
jgi:hypothetical protein